MEREGVPGVQQVGGGPEDCFYNSFEAFVFFAKCHPDLNLNPTIENNEELPVAHREGSGLKPIWTLGV